MYASVTLPSTVIGDAGAIAATPPARLPAMDMW
jgi:hypothetical protein